jgi:hypothetical protein
MGELLSGTAAAEQQDEGHHVADDERRAAEDGHIPLCGHTRDGPDRCSMGERNEDVERPNQRARPGEAPSCAPTPAQPQKGSGSKKSGKRVARCSRDRELDGHARRQVRDQEAQPENAEHLRRNEEAQSRVRRKACRPGPHHEVRDERPEVLPEVVDSAVGVLT